MHRNFTGCHGCMQWRRHGPGGGGGGGGQGGNCPPPPPHDFFIYYYFFFFCWSAQRSVLAMIIPLPHYENNLGSRSNSETFCPPPPLSKHPGAAPGCMCMLLMHGKFTGCMADRVHPLYTCIHALHGANSSSVQNFHVS